MNKAGIDKAGIIQCICRVLRSDLATLQAAYQTSHENATHAESVAENKYDTRGLEAAYLAHGQAKRAEEIEIALHAYETISPKLLLAPHTRIALNSLVQLEDQHEQRRWFWLGANTGGLKFQHNDRAIAIITPQSPLGSVLMGREKHDAFELKINDNVNEYEIIELQ
ncbi:transcription elongation factor GreAB [Pseudomonadota bacterium]